MEVCKKGRKNAEKGEVWKGKEGRKCEAGAGRSRFLSPTNSGCFGFAEIWMS